MSDQVPESPYVYQPYGIQHPDHWHTGRIYAIAGLGPLVEIKGLTRQEAEQICGVLDGTWIDGHGPDIAKSATTETQATSDPLGFTNKSEPSTERTVGSTQELQPQSDSHTGPQAAGQPEQASEGK